MTYSNGLSVSNVVNVSVDVSPTAAATRNFGAPLIVGPSDIIDTSERMRKYAGIVGVTDDFGTATPEYYAADLLFSQSPQPSMTYVGRWAQSATSGLVRGAILTTAQKALANFTAVTAGSMTITVDGTAHALTGLNFSAALNLNGVASIVNTALPSAVMTWDATNSQFVVASVTSGVDSSVSAASNGSTGTPVAALFGLLVGSATTVPGIDAETLVSAVSTFLDLSTAWYALNLAVESTDDLDLDDLQAAAALIEAASPSRVMFLTTQNTGAINSSSTSDLLSVLAATGYRRTFVQYSSTSPYAAASAFGRAATVDFTGSNTTLTLMFKQEPGVTAETLTQSQASALAAKKGNVFVNYENDTAILQNGWMTDGTFLDEVMGLDALQNGIQTDLYNALYTSTTKVPQTNAGNQLLATVAAKRLQAFVDNGFIAPGVWDGASFGSLNNGDTLAKGFYIYVPDISTQSAADRQARKSVALQIAIKLAGAIHSVDVTINVNR